jgi:hypothetical protein
VFEIKGSEQLADASIEVRLSGLYTVRGKVLAKEDSHAPNQAFVSLADRTDKTFGRGAYVQQDGTYILEHVPAGTYTLTVTGAQDVADPDELDRQAKPVVLRMFEGAKMEVVVIDEDANLPEILLEAKAKTQ